MNSKVLGLTASSPRHIKPGHQYDKYFNTAELVRSDQVVLEGTTFDTLDQMARIVQQTLGDTKAISNVLKGSDRYTTARNIWQFLYDHIDYVKDSTEFEELRRPLRTWADRKGDCDCYSIFISSVLTNLGIDHAYRMAGYKSDFQHVYVVVPKQEEGNIQSRSNYIVIDPVTDQFDYEVPFSKKFDKIMKMPIKYLNGIDQLTTNTSISQPQQQVYNYPYGFEFVTLGMDGLGSIDQNPASPAGRPALLAEDFVRRMRMHLLNTHKELTKNSSIPGGYELAAQIDQVLQVWDNPQLRDTLIAKFSTGNGGLDGLGGLFDKIGDAFRKVGDAIGDGWEKVKEVSTTVGTAVLRYNPVTASARVTAEAVFRNNLFNVSTKLGYGYYSEQQVRANNMNMDHWRDYVHKRQQVEKLWVDFLGGRKDKMKDFVLMGHQTGTKKRNLPRIASHLVGRPEPTKATTGLNGLGLGSEPVTAVVGAAASTTFIAKITSLLKDLIDPKELFHQVASRVLTNRNQPQAYSDNQYAHNYEYPKNNNQSPQHQYVVPAQDTESAYQGGIIPENNINKWLLMGAAGLATILMVSSGSKDKKPQINRVGEKGVSGIPKSNTGASKRKRKRESLPTMVMS